MIVLRDIYIRCYDYMKLASRYYSNLSLEQMIEASYSKHGTQNTEHGTRNTEHGTQNYAITHAIAML